MYECGCPRVVVWALPVAGVTGGGHGPLDMGARS